MRQAEADNFKRQIIGFFIAVSCITNRSDYSETLALWCCPHTCLALAIDMHQKNQYI